MTEQQPSQQAFGPYESESDAAMDAIDVTALPPATGQWTRANVDKLLSACRSSGVELGDYDELVVKWIARWEPQAVQVVVGLISRAGAR